MGSRDAPKTEPRTLDELFVALARSPFRAKFHLGAREREYIAARDLDMIADHARQFIRTRLAPAAPPRDGRQTPFHGHPVFVAQHATGTCCRGCLAKWHGIAKGAALSEAEIERVLTVIMAWIAREVS